MKMTFFLFTAFIFINELNAQVNPAQKVVTNSNVAANRNVRLSDSISGGPIRFGASMSGDFGTSKNFSFSPRYNTNAFMTSVTTDGITIRKSGLYHFEGFVYAEAFDDNDKANGFANPQFTSILKVGETNYTVGYREIMPGTEYFNRGQLDSRNFKFSKSFSMDIYIVAPATIRFNRNFTSTITNESQFYSGGWLTGYYMSE
jgi:hypothetical protein